MVPTRLPTKFLTAPPVFTVSEGDREDEVPVLEGKLDHMAAESVEVTTDDVAGMLEDAIPSSTV